MNGERMALAVVAAVMILLIFMQIRQYRREKVREQQFHTLLQRLTQQQQIISEITGRMQQYFEAYQHIEQGG